MSTRCTIGSTENVHLYEECNEDMDVFIAKDRPYEVIKVCTANDWKAIHANIIQSFLQKLMISTLNDDNLPKKVWEYDGAGPLKKEELVKAFTRFVETLS